MKYPTATLYRYIRLYYYFFVFSVKKTAEFRIDFLFTVLMDIVFYAVHFLFYRVIYLHTPSLYGWDVNQASIFVTFFFMIDACYMLFFSRNLWALSQLLNRGDLDIYLTRPVSTLFFVTLRDATVPSIVNLVLSGGLFGWSVLHWQGANSTLWIARHLPLILFGITTGLLMHCMMQLLFIFPVFWSPASASGLHQLFWTFSRLAERPDRIYRGWIKWIVLTVFPFGLIASYPSRLLVEPFSFAVFAHIALACVAFATLVLWVWKKALNQYSSASS